MFLNYDLSAFTRTSVGISFRIILNFSITKLHVEDERMVMESLFADP